MDLSPVGLLTWYFIRESTLKMTLNYVIKTMTILAFDFCFYVIPESISCSSENRGSKKRTG